ncbi:uncharacterized protein LOC131669123 isoform X2 [Phymastichus coffea]|nr:uncharacterized protein LOC131669123 isoform X2 [Phymastichus coffea]
MTILNGLINLTEFMLSQMSVITSLVEVLHEKGLGEQEKSDLTKKVFNMMTLMGEAVTCLANTCFNVSFNPDYHEEAKTLQIKCEQAEPIITALEKALVKCGLQEEIPKPNPDFV